MLIKQFKKGLLHVFLIFVLFINTSENYNLYASPKCAASCSDDLINYIEPLQSGQWQDVNIWPGGILPSANENVSIPPNITVELSGVIEANVIEIHGTLKAVYQPLSDAWINLTTKAIHVMHGGNLEIGTNTNPYYGDCLITLIGNDPTEIICPAMGTKFIGAMDGGTINLHGKPKVSWTQLDTTAIAGSNQIRLKEPVNWQVGDKIVIAPSRIDWQEAEEKTIAALNTDSTIITLTESLMYSHIGTIKQYTRDTDGKTWQADLRAEIGLLSHNIKIQGDDFSEVNGFGGHIMIHGDAEGYVDGIELYRMGQKSSLGTYPFHWHRVGNIGNGQYFKNSSVHKSYNRAITIHATESVTVDNNFFYDHIGHGVYLEDGCERFNTITNNVVLVTRKPVIGEEVTQSDIFGFDNALQDRSPSSFWISNPNNIFENNVAAGTAGTGYWFAFPDRPMGPSKTDPRFKSQKPDQEPLGSFDKNKAHSCGRGFDIFDGMTDNHEINSNEGWPNGQMNYITNCTWYSNDLAIYTGINRGVYYPDNVIFENHIFIENEIALMLASYSLVTESVFVSNSGENLMEGNRYLYRVYDGAGRVENSHLVGWDQLNSNFLINTGAALKHVNHLFSNITKNDDESIRMELPNMDIIPQGFVGANNVSHPRYWSLVLKDVDGSLGGKPNTSIISNHPFLLTGQEFQAAEWTNVYRSDHSFALSLVNYNLSAANNPNVTITRTKPGTPTESVYYINGYKEHHQLPFIVNDDFLYTYQYESLPTSKWVKLYMDDATLGDRYLCRFKNFGQLSGLNISSFNQNLVAFDHLDSLKNAAISGYFIEPNGDLYIQPIATGKNQKFDIKWSSHPNSWNEFDLDGDGSSDGYEANAGRNPFDESDLASNFETNFDEQEWDNNTSNLETLTAFGGLLTGAVGAIGNGQIIKSNYSFQADSINSIIVRMKASQNTRVKLFWDNSDTGSFNLVNSSTKWYSGNGTFRILEFKLDENEAWNGTIKGLKLQIINPNTNFDIDYIKSLDENMDNDGDGYNTAAENILNRAPFSASDLCFDFSAHSDGWEKNPHIENECFGCEGGWSVQSNNNDPQIRFSNFNFEADSVPKIYVDIFSENTGKVSLFWTTTGAKNFSSSRKKNANYFNSERKVLVFDLSSHPEWNGKTITKLRIDPVGAPGETIFYGICATELCYPNTSEFITSISTMPENCDYEDGSMTINFEDNPYKTGIEFSLDGGVTYENLLNDTIGSITYNNLTAGDYALFARWNDGTCEENIGNFTIQIDPIKNIFVVPDNESCSGKDGSFSFYFFENPNQSAIEFSLDGGLSFQPAVNDSVGTVIYNSLDAGLYNLKARWENTNCVEDLGLFEIKAEPKPTASILAGYTSCETAANGTLTFNFPDVPNQTAIEFSLDGGINYQPAISDTLQTLTYNDLSAGTYHIKTRWADGLCEEDLGMFEIEAESFPNIIINNYNETCAGNDGSITFNFSDHPNYNYFAFSLDGGSTYLADIADSLNTITYNNLSAGDYHLFAGFENGTCPTNLETVITIEAQPDSDTDGICDLLDICTGHDDDLDDDIDGIPDGCDPCPNFWEDLSLQNLTIDPSAKIEAITNCTVPNQANITIKAGQVIHLDSGFSVEVGADFEAYIDTCVD